MNTKQPSCIAESNQSPQAESHHGDLRKCAYLKRRAAYQLQASSASTMQAGGVATPAAAAAGQLNSD